jgi:hypothetical protein
MKCSQQELGNTEGLENNLPCKHFTMACYVGVLLDLPIIGKMEAPIEWWWWIFHL